MIGTGIDARVQVQQIIENQLPEFLISENPKVGDFLKQIIFLRNIEVGLLTL